MIRWYVTIRVVEEEAVARIDHNIYALKRICDVPAIISPGRGYLLSDYTMHDSVGDQ